MEREAFFCTQGGSGKSAAPHGTAAPETDSMAAPEIDSTADAPKSRKSTLDALAIGACACVVSVGGSGSLRQHLLDMGLIPQAVVTMVKHAPMGDPVEVRVHGYELTLRLADAREIQVEPIDDASLVFPSGEHGFSSDSESGSSCDSECSSSSDGKCASSSNKRAFLRGKRTSFGARRTPSTPSAASAAKGGAAPRARANASRPHPGFGEGGKYHDKATETPLPQGEVLTFALAGNQNCGKTTLFNQLTGANQHVGNFPGVTVDRKDGAIKGHADTLVTDLPGIYSMSPYSSEEIVTREFLLNERPRGIINIVDATNIERNLYLTMQLLELGCPMVLALNMMDEMEGNGGTVRVNEMEELLGIPVIPIAAAKNEGIAELVDHALHVARFQEPPAVQDFCAPDEHGGAVHRCLHGIMALIEDHAQAAGIPPRFAASKLAEGDELVLSKLGLDQNEKEMLDHIVRQMEAERGLDRAAAMADMRFSFIENVCARTVVKPHESREHARSVAIDKVLTGPFTAIPAFVAIMALVFWLTFNVVGAWLSDALDAGISVLTDAADIALVALQVNEVVRSCVIDGVFNGVGSVVGFLPIIVTLFFFLSLLEDSGYMARVAFVMDKLLRRIGLSGRSIVPMLIGFGCTVPAVMASRTLPSERDRKMTVLLTPYMSCSAKLPIYAFFTAAFFPHEGALIMVALYFGGIAVGVLVALLMRKVLFSGEAVPFVMELPNYRMPSARSVAQLLWEKARDFLQRAFTVIFLATLVVWFLQTFDFGLNVVADSRYSMLAVVAGWVAPVFAPLGFGDWRISTALITGIMAKESVVSTLSILFGSTGALVAAIPPAAALSLLVFCLLYTPCIAALASVRRELGGRWAFGVAVWQIAVAWVVAAVVYGVALLAMGCAFA